MKLDHFDILAPFYDRAIRASLSPDLIELLDPRLTDHILDAAGGTGRLAAPLRPLCARVVVADIAAGMLAQARGKSDLHPVRASTSALPFAPFSFDRILMVDALHHIRDQAAAVHELWRLLKPGGRLLIEEPDISTLTVKLIALAEFLAVMRSRFLTLEQIISLPGPLPGQVISRRKDHTVWVVWEKEIS
jgi:demethylmenaquinone methyltransferase/2-methoxy-6-polyprenyl-1,4-benzoquinol methylase